jgi:predicted RNA methylase
MAGAKRVYAVEACSNMAEAAQEVMKENCLDDTVTVLHGKIEDVTIPEKVAVIACMRPWHTVSHTCTKGGVAWLSLRSRNSARS